MIEALDKVIKTCKNQMSCKPGKEPSMNDVVNINDYKNKRRERKKKNRNRKKEEILRQLRSKPNLQIFIRNAMGSLSKEGLREIVEHAKSKSGDINPDRASRVTMQLKSAGRVPIPNHIIRSTQFSPREQRLLRFLFLCIHYFYE